MAASRRTLLLFASWALACLAACDRSAADADALAGKYVDTGDGATLALSADGACTMTTWSGDVPVDREGRWSSADGVDLECAPVDGGPPWRVRVDGEILHASDGRHRFERLR